MDIVSHMFDRWGSAVARRHWIVLVAALLAAVISGSYGIGVGSNDG